jgi:hypothetical protein
MGYQVVLADYTEPRRLEGQITQPIRIVTTQSYNLHMPRQTVTENSILDAALIGLQHQHAEYTAKIAEIRRTLGIRAPQTNSGQKTVIAARPKRKISVAARKRIGEATKKRWAAYRAGKAATGKKVEKPAAKKSAMAGKKKAAVKKVATKEALAKKSAEKNKTASTA